MKVDFVNPFLTASYSVLGAVVGTIPEKGPVKVQPGNATNHQVNVVCGVTGMIHGQIIVGMCQTAANRLASVMSGQNCKIFDSFVASAIAELTNMISGNALMGLSEAGYICDITPPTIVRGANVEISTLNIPAISIYLDTGYGEIAVTVSLCESTATAKSRLPQAS